VKIRDIPWFNRPGFKLTRNGVNSLDDAELLAIIFGVGNKKESALELANKLLKKYNFNKIDDLGVSELKEECGLVNSLKVFGLIELSKRYNKLVSNGFTKSITSAEDVFNRFKDRFRNCKKEVFIVLYLDSKNKIIKEEEVSVGILDSVLIHPREVFRTAIKESANSIILVHNHPSGDCNPSKSDTKTTERLFETGDLIGIKVLDHIIISKDRFFTFKDNKVYPITN